MDNCHFQKELKSFASHPERIIVWMREKFPETLIVLPSFNQLCLNMQKYRDDSDFIEYKSVHIIKIKLKNQCNLIHMKEKHDLIKVSVMSSRGQLYTKLGLQKPRQTWLERQCRGTVRGLLFLRT